MTNPYAPPESPPPEPPRRLELPIDNGLDIRLFRMGFGLFILVAGLSFLLAPLWFQMSGPRPPQHGLAIFQLVTGGFFSVIGFSLFAFGIKPLKWLRFVAVFTVCTMFLALLIAPAVALIAWVARLMVS